MDEPLPYLAIGIIAGLAALTYVALVGAAQLLRRTRGFRFGLAYHAFAAAAGALAGLHYVSLFVGAVPDWVDALRQHVAAAAILLAAFPAITLINRLLWVRTGPQGRPVEAPRVLADTTALVVFVALALAVLHFFYGVRIPGLLAGSGVAAIIIGLAMQDLLGNIFGGLAIYLEKPFRPGDWLQIEGRDARVMEVNWRSTRLLTNDDVLIDVPNANIVKNTIMNYEKPTPRHAMRASIGLHYDIPPARAQAVLRQAASTVPGVVDSPRPVVWLREFAASAITYEIKFWIDDHRLAPRILSEVRSHAWYAVRRASMEIPFPIVTLHRARRSDEGTASRVVAARALRNHPIFSLLGAEAVDQLVRQSPIVLFAPTEHIIEQGEKGDSMFLLVRGRVEVLVTHAGSTDVAARFGPGDCFGEMSLLTGEPRTATVVATEEVEAVEITRGVLTPLIHENPSVLNSLSDLLAQRQAATEQLAAAASPAAAREARRANMLHRLRRFFFLGD